MNFDDLGLMPSLLKAVRQKGYEVPSPIQEKAIPLILKGRDILASLKRVLEKLLASHFLYYKGYLLMNQKEKEILEH